METRFDERKWPDLTRFREACLADRYEEMQRIADRGHHWYPNENPLGLAMQKLALVYRAQFHASENSEAELKELVASEPWVVNHPWTAQGWLPITQAACAHGDRQTIELLLSAGADLTLLVGDPDDQATAASMAESGGHAQLAEWLQGLIDEAS